MLSNGKLWQTRQISFKATAWFISCFFFFQLVLSHIHHGGNGCCPHDTLSLCQQLHCLTGEINLVVSRFICAFYITVNYSNSAGWLVGALNTYLVCGQARDSNSKYVKFWLACSWCSGLAKFLPEWCVLFIFQISPAQPSSLWPAHVARSFRYLIDPTRQQTTWN